MTANNHMSSVLGFSTRITRMEEFRVSVPESYHKEKRDWGRGVRREWRVGGGRGEGGGAATTPVVGFEIKAQRADK